MTSSPSEPARRVFVSSTAFADPDLETVLAGCASEGIEALELSVVRNPDLALLDPATATMPLPHLLVHNYFPPPADPFLLNLASADPANLARSRAHCRAAIDLSARLGAPVYGAHAGYSYDLPPRLLGRPAEQARIPLEAMADPESTFARLVQSARELAAYASVHGVRFLIENHVCSALAGEAGRRLLPAVTPEDLAALVAAVDHPSFGILVDVGHARVSGAAIGFTPDRLLDAVDGHIGAFHLSDNDGLTDQHLAFGADAWFLPRLRRAPAATLTVELAPTDPETIRQTVALVKEAA